MAVWHWPGSRAVRVIDGDSLVAEVTRRTALTIDLGFNGTAQLTHVATFRQKLRLARINALPSRTALGRDATRRATELVAGADLNIDTVGPYKYGDEWMAEVTLPDGRNLSDVLAQEGFAVYWNGEGPRPDTPAALAA